MYREASTISAAGCPATQQPVQGSAYQNARRSSRPMGTLPIPFSTIEKATLPCLQRGRSTLRPDAGGNGSRVPLAGGLQLERHKRTGKRVACTAGDFVPPIEEPLAEATEPPPVEEELSQATLIWRAVKLPIYTVALIPILVGAAAAYQKTGVFYHSRFWTLLGSSCLVIAWLNLTNDVFDSDTEVDKNKKESVVNMTGSRNLVLVIAIALLIIAFGGFAWLAKTVNDPRMLWLLGAAVACGYVYQSPPFRLGYMGLGEPLCFVSFGPLATSAFYLSQVKKSCCKALPEVTPTVLGASVLVGITTTLILFCSHFHQIEDDAKVGKMSPLVRLGTARGAQVASAAVTALYFVTGGLVGTKLLPTWCGILSALTIPLGKLVKNFISKNHENKVVIFMAKYFATRLHIAHGVAIALGLAASVWKPLPSFW
ncbi:1,4-dihydroxy-2-naphthoate octaprenyltransferase [Klebsormidium nitens]|uniref:1,4-dihydroxy-2-naphthoate octaprenyltransferase n=1 Tax=Klebsormidium nitens TaxID=105231 RepID=A0A1Y1ICQ0_KLENI|nr:1,4-dihydroxy-2-naphthoate octaprenyltransferase [Klebsormidium nitens]|eukprot:GAQ88734.1 1,4-dihydroxy-2-naphthoate octaprenyltransferase [Klebsormidium nitens]